MTIEELTSLENLFDCTFTVERTGSPDWVNIYVIMKSRNTDGVRNSIGIIKFHTGKFYYFKPNFWHERYIKENIVREKISSFIKDRKTMSSDFAKLRLMARQSKEKNYGSGEF